MGFEAICESLAPSASPIMVTISAITLRYKGTGEAGSFVKRGNSAQPAIPAPIASRLRGFVREGYSSEMGFVGGSVPD